MPPPDAPDSRRLGIDRPNEHTRRLSAMNASIPMEHPTMSTSVLSYYEAIEKASADMLHAARSGDWDQVVKLEGACVLLISQLKQAARELPLGQDEAKLKSRIMQRILVNDAEVRNLAEPWLPDLHRLMHGKSSTLH
jgi:flagellar protein FliT